MSRLFAVLCCVVLLGAAGCATTGGVEVAGRASQVSPPPTEPPLPSGTPVSTDAVAVLRADPVVSKEVKAALVPCDSGGYPVDDRYSDLTGDGVAELVVTVFPCKILREVVPSGLGIGLAGYVYDVAADPPERLLSIEDDGGVELLVNSERRLMVLSNGYRARDEPCCPTDQRFAFYVWNGTALVAEGKR